MDSLCSSDAQLTTAGSQEGSITGIRGRKREQMERIIIPSLTHRHIKWLIDSDKHTH